MLSLKDSWIKAAIEHRTLTIRYHSGRTKGEYTVREVEPDYYGYDVTGKNNGCWGLCRLRGDVRCFKEDSIIDWHYTGNTYSPNPLGRWQELIPIYKARKLDQTHW
jgi:predicted DNA-binding transcriptional regulator YafY